jgi:hypothetical protein
MDLNQQIEAALNTLEVLYFFTQGLNGPMGQDVKDVRQHFEKLPRETRKGLLATIKSDIKSLRDHYGALASNHFYEKVYEEIREAKSGLGYIGKLNIDRLFFSHYEKVLSRWPHVKEHAFVVFDPAAGMLNALFELDGQLFHDAQFLLQKARQVQAGAASQRALPRARHRVLHSLLRPVVTALFTFVEAYLNGIAYDCFHKHHGALDLSDHDLLAEWDSQKKRQRFVSFDQKVFKYPAVVARAEGRQIDLSGLKAAHRIIRDGKEVRDAITHPSAHYDPVLREQKKVTLLAGLTVPELESLYQDVVAYVRFVEEGIGHDAAQSIPWLFDDLGFATGRDEAI